MTTDQLRECWHGAERRWASFSADDQYRWVLGREWDPQLPRVAFCGLNPSKAGAVSDDATVRLWRGIASRAGYGGFVAVNAYAFIATDPKALAGKPMWATIGVSCNQAIRNAVNTTDRFVACWGAWCEDRRSRDIVDLVTDLGKPIFALGLTQRGQPRHPRGVSKTATFVQVVPAKMKLLPTESC